MRTYSKKKISDVSLKMPMKEYLEDSSAKSFKDTMTELQEKKKAYRKDIDDALERVVDL